MHNYGRVYVSTLDGAPELAFDRSRVHIVKCPKCSWPLGETTLAAGAMHRYRCKGCREWTWLLVVDVPGTGAGAASAATT